MRKRHPRVAIYSHDTFGLGHITRSLRIAEGIVGGFPETSVLIISGSPVAHRFRFPQGVDYVKLPAVVKRGAERYVSQNLFLSSKRIRRLRRRLIREIVDSFRPQLFMVDNVPLGMRGEILPALRRLREKSPETEIHLNLRDILDESESIRGLWQEKDVPALLEEFYDAIHVYGSRDVYDAVSAYDLPPAKTDFLGYLGSGHRAQEQSSSIPATSNGAARILVTIGGGGDGEEILRSVIALQRFLGCESPYLFHIVTGPLMPTAVREDIVSQLRGTSGVTLHEYVAGLPEWMSQCDLVLSMGGYNTLCEVMAHAKRSLVIPRQQPRVEQVLRASALAARGLLHILSFDDLSSATLHGALQSCLDQDPVIEPSRRPPLNGIERLRERLAPLLGNGAAEPFLPAVSLAEARTPQSLVAASDAGDADKANEEWA